MTKEQLHAAAMAQPAATHVRLWGRTDVYKVGGKVFAVCEEADGLSFRASPIAYEVLVRDGPGRPAPGFVPGGWANLALADLQPDDTAGWIAQSHGLAVAALTRKARTELGLT